MVSWYATEGGKGKINSPNLCVWTNKFQDWPLKGRYERKSNYSHSMIYSESRSEWKPRAACTPWPVIGWTERGMWVIVVAWPDEVEEEKGAIWLARAFRTKNSAFSSEEIWKGIFSFEDRNRREKMCWFIAQKLRVCSPAKKESLVLDIHWQEMGAKLAKLRGKSRTESLDRR